jgi:hypothetical protein
MIVPRVKGLIPTPSTLVSYGKPDDLTDFLGTRARSPAFISSAP